MKLFKWLIFFLFINIQCIDCQIDCRAVTSEMDGISLMFEYNKEKILNNKSLRYKKDLHLNDTVKIIDFVSDYVIAIFREDTFAIECSSLKSDCEAFNKYAYDINLQKAIRKYGEENLGLLPVSDQAKVIGNNVFIHGVNNKKKRIPIDNNSFLQVIGIIDGKAYILYNSDIYWTYIDLLSGHSIDREKDKISQEKEQKKLERYNMLWGRIRDLQSEDDFIKAQQPVSVSISGSSMLDGVFGDLPTVATGQLTFIGIKDGKAYVVYKDKLYKTDYGNLSSPVLDSIYVVMDNRVKEEKKRTLQKQKMNIEKRRQRLVDEYGEEIANTIMKGSVRIGMTKKMAIEAWGKPIKVNTTTTIYGVHEQWVYGSSNYLYFEDGKLTSIQN